MMMYDMKCFGICTFTTVAHGQYDSSHIHHSNGKCWIYFQIQTHKRHPIAYKVMAWLKIVAKPSKSIDNVMGCDLTVEK